MDIASEEAGGDSTLSHPTVPTLNSASPLPKTSKSALEASMLLALRFIFLVPSASSPKE